MSRGDVPADVAAIRAEIAKLLNTTCANGRRVGSALCGVYAFYDYDNEPIYVGQTTEALQVRIQRHLTNQRTDAVAMNVLDPFEVAYIKMWPFFDMGKKDPGTKEWLDRAEYTVYQAALKESRFQAVLNEGVIAKRPVIELPACISGRIIPASIFEQRKHPDIRIARRSSTIAALARVISERAVSPGLRMTLLTQAKRLEHLANLRQDQVAKEKPSAAKRAASDPGADVEE